MHSTTIADRLQLWCEFFATDEATITNEAAQAGGFDVDELVYQAQKTGQPALLALAQRCQMLMDSWCDAQDMAELGGVATATVH